MTARYSSNILADSVMYLKVVITPGQSSMRRVGAAAGILTFGKINLPMTLFTFTFTVEFV